MTTAAFPRLRSFFMVFFGLLILWSCEKEDDSSIPDPSGGPDLVDGRFSDYLSCDIIAPPAAVNLSSYYKKYINCNGIPVIGSENVPDEALLLASETIGFLLNDLSSIRNQLVRDGNYAVLYEEGSSIAELPEGFYSNGNNTGVYEWNNNHRALASDVQSLLCAPEVGYGHTLVHEVAHMIDIGGIRQLNSSFSSQLSTTYNQAMSAGLWQNTYARTNKEEYFAEAFTIWYGVNWIGPQEGDGSRNNIGSRGDLEEYDPNIYELLTANINSRTNLPGCRRPVIDNASANCPETVSDIDGNIYEVINIGPMCWMKENLRTTHYRDGSAIAEITDKGAWQSASQGGWSYYDNNPSNDAIFGKIYNGYALENDNLCPQGWRVPTVQDLQDLVNYGGGDYAAVHLRSLEYWDTSEFPPTNSSGFGAVPAGIRNQEGFFEGLGTRTNLGSQTTSEAGKYYTKPLFHNLNYIFTDNTSKNVGVSCRCIKE